MASDSITTLRNGSLLPPIDDITANGLAIWKDSPPLYHDLKCTTYTFNDLSEWSGKYRKYKAEAVHYAMKCKKLEQDVYKLHMQLAQKNDEIEKLNNRYYTVQSNVAEHEKSIQSCNQFLNTAGTECIQLRKGVYLIKKQKNQLDNEINQILLQTRNLQHEVKCNREKHDEVSGEREKLNFERRWFFRQRLLLQKTTEEESKNVEVIRDQLNKLRFCLQKSWRDAKELDILGHLRARQNYDFTPEWYAARRRLITTSRTSPPQS